MFNHFISLNTSRKNVIFRLRYTSKYVLNTSYFSEPFSASSRLHSYVIDLFLSIADDL